MLDIIRWEPRAISSFWQPTLDMHDNGDALVVRAEMPGIKPEDITIEVRGNLLTITGKTQIEEQAVSWWRMQSEQYYRQIVLPVSIQVAKADAMYEHGVLTITLPKGTAGSTQTIKVRSGSFKLRNPLAKLLAPFTRRAN